ncbi:conjugal transfer protein TrbL, partial [Xanthomonas citri pv. citri]|nr:conjugal transfer protein TrbL [Xanthomonas citri pv. citri]
AFAPYLTYKFISFIGFDMYHAIGSEQYAKQALNRPVPTPTKPAGDGPQKVLDGGNSGGNESGGGGGSGAGGKTPPQPKTSAPQASGGGASAAGG